MQVFKYKNIDKTEYVRVDIYTHTLKYLNVHSSTHLSYSAHNSYINSIQYTSSIIVLIRYTSIVITSHGKLYHFSR